MKRLLSAALALSLLSTAPACKGDPATPEYWTKALEGADGTQARVRVVEGLRASGKLSPAFLPALHAQLAREKSPEVKAVLARVLGEMKDPSSVQPLTEALDLGNTDRAGNAMNKEIVVALSAIGDKKAVPTLQKMLRSRDPYTKIAAIESLGEMRATEAVGQLETLASDPGAEPFVCKKAIQALGNIGSPESVPVLVKMMLKERKGVSFYAEASFALYQIGEPATGPLLAALKGEDKALFQWAGDNNVKEAGILAKSAQVLGDLHVKEAEPVLVQRLKYDGGDDAMKLIVRMFSADALGRMGASGASKHLIPLLSEEEANARQQYVRTLVRMGGSGALPALTKAANSGSWDAREPAMMGLAMLGGQAELAAFDKLLKEEEKRTTAECKDNPDYRGCNDVAALVKAHVTAIENHRKTLAGSVGATDAAAWVARLASPEAGVRERAAYELGRLGGAEHVEKLAPLTADKNLDVRVATFQALDWLTDKGADAVAKGKAALPSWQKQLAEESGMTAYVRVNEDLKRLVAKLQRS
jgi:HEAT repeat protein